MKRFLAMVLVTVCVLSGCATSSYRDNQVYIVNQGRHAAEKDELLNWLPVEGPKPFQHTPWDAETVPAGSVPLYVDEANNVMWLFESDEAVIPFEGNVLGGEMARKGRLVALHLADGERKEVLASLPFVIKVIVDKSLSELYLFGGGHLTRVDLKKEKATAETSAMQAGSLRNVFVSPLEPNKLFLETFGITGGVLYYPDTGRSVLPYQTRDRLYYKATLEKPYYYATEWRAIKDDMPDNLWTVIADERNQVVRVLGQGDFVAGYEKKVLIKDTNSFGLSLMTDLNVPEEVVRICRDYVYQAGFFAGGEMYWIGDGKDSGKPYLLHLLDINGRHKLSVPLSGSEVLLDPTGYMAYGSGPEAETIDLHNGKVVARQERFNVLKHTDAKLLTSMMLTVNQYGRYMLNDPDALTPLHEIVADPLVMESIQRPEAKKEEILKGQVHLSAKIKSGSVAPTGHYADFVFEVLALSEHGRLEERTLTVTYHRSADRWLIESFAVSAGK